MISVIRTQPRTTSSWTAWRAISPETATTSSGSFTRFSPAEPISSQLRSNELNKDDTLYFSHAFTKLLPAEVLLDAISTVTSTTTPFDGLPKGARATQIPDGKMENPFLKTFGRPARELACECERESDFEDLLAGPTTDWRRHG